MESCPGPLSWENGSERLDITLCKFSCGSRYYFNLFFLVFKLIAEFIVICGAAAPNNLPNFRYEKQTMFLIVWLATLKIQFRYYNMKMCSAVI